MTDNQRGYSRLCTTVRVGRRRLQDFEAHKLHSKRIQRSPARMTIYPIWSLSGSRQWSPQGANRMSFAGGRESDFDGLREIRSIRRVD